MLVSACLGSVYRVMRDNMLRGDPHEMSDINAGGAAEKMLAVFRLASVLVAYYDSSTQRALQRPM